MRMLKEDEIITYAAHNSTLHSETQISLLKNYYVTAKLFCIDS
jgi:hypothetical protein